MSYDREQERRDLWRKTFDVLIGSPSGYQVGEAVSFANAAVDAYDAKFNGAGKDAASHSEPAQ